MLNVKSDSLLYLWVRRLDEWAWQARKKHVRLTKLRLPWLTYVLLWRATWGRLNGQKTMSQGPDNTLCWYNMPDDVPPPNFMLRGVGIYPLKYGG